MACPFDRVNRSAGLECSLGDASNYPNPILGEAIGFVIRDPRESIVVPLPLIAGGIPHRLKLVALPLDSLDVLWILVPRLAYSHFSLLFSRPGGLCRRPSSGVCLARVI